MAKREFSIFIISFSAYKYTCFVEKLNTFRLKLNFLRILKLLKNWPIAIVQEISSKILYFYNFSDAYIHVCTCICKNLQILKMYVYYYMCVCL